MQREGQERQGCLKRVCPRALSTDAYKWSQKVGLQGCIKSVTLNRCTMQRHKWLSLQDAATLMADEAVTHRPQTTTIAMDAKPTKHTQALALRKARGIVRFWKVWCKRRMVVRQSLRLDGKKFDKSKRRMYRKQNATKRQFVSCRQSTSL